MMILEGARMVPGWVGSRHDSLERWIMAADWTASPVVSHEMVCEAETSSEALFVCLDEACGRRVVVGKSRPRLTVIDRGDFSVRHAGFLGGLALDEVTLA